MELNNRDRAIIHGIISIVAFFYFLLPFYILIFAPFLIISIGLAATSRFNLAYKFGGIWLVITGVIIIPSLILSVLSTSILAMVFFNYFSVGLIFYLLVLASTRLLYKNREITSLKAKKKKNVIVSSDTSFYCQYCGSEIQEGDNVCSNCQSSVVKK